MGSSSSQSGRTQTRSRASATRRRCPAERYATGRSWTWPSPRRSSASRGIKRGAPRRSRAKVRFSPAVSADFSPSGGRRHAGIPAGSPRRHRRRRSAPHPAEATGQDREQARFARPVAAGDGERPASPQGRTSGRRRSGGQIGAGEVVDVEPHRSPKVRPVSRDASSAPPCPIAAPDGTAEVLAHCRHPEGSHEPQ